jgi:hypothetical protein
MTRRRWYDSDNPTTVVRGVTWRGYVWIACTVIFVAAISIGVWAFKVHTSDVRGQGDAVSRKNSGDNRIAQQEAFEKLYAEIKAADQRIDVAAAAKKAQPGDVIAETNYTGAMNYCIGVVADYNAKARSYTAEQWRAADLPAQIDTTDPATDCKESAK